MEEKEKLRQPRDFIAASFGEVDAVVIRIGLHDAQLVLVDADGGWQRWVYHSVDEAQAAVGDLDIPVHVGEYPEELRVRINRHVRSPQEFDRAAYPEQGSVGPVIPYPENRPRHLDVLQPETSEQASQEG